MSKLLSSKNLTAAAAVIAALLLQANAWTQEKEKEKGMQMAGMSMMQTAESKKLESHVKAVKTKAGRKGYDCCIRPSCEWCAVHMGHCMCHHSVESGTGPCRECHGGWEAGQGEVSGKTKEDVRNMPVMKM